MDEKYSYIFHCNSHRPIEKRWACVHRDYIKHYWNGNNGSKFSTEKNERDLKIYFGETPEKAWENKEYVSIFQRS